MNDKSSSHLVFVITIQSDQNSDLERYEILEQTLLGSGPLANICIKDKEIAPLHCVFDVNTEKNVLTVQPLTTDFKVFIQKQELKKDHPYVLEVGDVLHLGNLNLTIGKEEKSQNENINLKQQLEKKQKDKTRLVTAQHRTLMKRVSPAKLLKVQEEADLPTKIKKLSKNFHATPGPFARLWSLVLDASITYAVIHFIWPFFEITQNIPSLEQAMAPLPLAINQFISTWQVKIPEIGLIKSFIAVLTSLNFWPIYLAFSVQQIFFHILCGTSLGLFLMGTRNESFFLLARFKAFFRCLIGLITWPLIPLFDLPVLFGRRGLKEVLTASDLEFKPGMQRAVGAFVFIPLVSLIALLSPISLVLILERPVNVELTALIDQPRDEDGSGLLGDLPWADSHLSLPLTPGNWAYSTIENKNIILYILNPEKKNWAKLSWTSRPNMRELYTKAALGDPLLSTFHPDISRIIERKTGATTPEATADATSMVVGSLGLSPLGLVEHIRDHGPFVRGLGLLRHELFVESEMIPTPARAQLFQGQLLSNKDTWLALHSLDPGPFRRSLYLELALKRTTPKHWLLTYPIPNEVWAQSFGIKLMRGRKELAPGDGHTADPTKKTSEAILQGQYLWKMAQGQKLSEEEQSWLLSTTKNQAKKILLSEQSELIKQFSRKLEREELFFTTPHEIEKTPLWEIGKEQWAEMRKALLEKKGDYFESPLVPPNKEE